MKLIGEMIIMIDYIVGYDNGEPIYLSDLRPYDTFIGYKDKNGIVHIYQERTNCWVTKNIKNMSLNIFKSGYILVF